MNRVSKKDTYYNHFIRILRYPHYKNPFRKNKQLDCGYWISLYPVNGAKENAAPTIQIGEIKTGYQSQVFVGSQVTIVDLPQEVLQRLLKNLEEKDVAIDERDAKLIELAQKYKELEERLAKRSTKDDLVAQAKEKLDAGDLEGAEKLLLQSYEKNLQAMAENKKAAASDAFELGSLKELQLDYHRRVSR